jgi:hypothetical protein
VRDPVSRSRVPDPTPGSSFGFREQRQDRRCLEPHNFDNLTHFLSFNVQTGGMFLRCSFSVLQINLAIRPSLRAQASSKRASWQGRYWCRSLTSCQPVRTPPLLYKPQCLEIYVPDIASIFAREEKKIISSSGYLFHLTR